MDKGQAMVALKEAMSKLEPLPDEPHFASSDETIVRYLKSADWKLKDAEKNLMNTVEYRRQVRPLRLDCKWCHDRPGYHSMRQVGHDESGRPVIYANFAQASTHKNTVEDIVAHVTYLIENAKATMEVGVTTWVFVIDCTGMTLSACNPKLGYGMANVLSSHYPERLGLVICVNHNPMFHGVWKALKKVVSPGTSAKVRLVRSPSKMQQVFSTFFPEELSSWLMDEIELNKQKPLPSSQAEFWAAPSASSPSAPGSNSPHDPRGCPTYIREHLLPFYRNQVESKSSASSTAGAAQSSRGTIGLGSGNSAGYDGYGAGAVVPRHRPHPNIVDALYNVVHVQSTPTLEQAERLQAVSGPGVLPSDRVCATNGDLLSAEDCGGLVGSNDSDDFDDFDDDDEDKEKRKEMNGGERRIKISK